MPKRRGPQRDYPHRLTDSTKGLRKVTGYTPAELARRAAQGLPPDPGRDDPEPWHARQRAQLEMAVAA